MMNCGWWGVLDHQLLLFIIACKIATLSPFSEVFNLLYCIKVKFIFTLKNVEKLLEIIIWKKVNKNSTEM